MIILIYYIIKNVTIVDELNHGNIELRKNIMYRKTMGAILDSGIIYYAKFNIA